MSWLPESQDRLPLTWWKGQPVYLAAMLAIAGAASMVLTALIMAANPAALPSLVFSFSNAFERGFLWTIVTYAFVNPPSIWLILTTYLFWRFGEEVERHLGRRVFVKLLVALLLTSPLLLTLAGLAGARDWQAAGLGPLEFGVFLAFATLYPHAKISLIIVTIEAWVFAAILVGVGVLSDLAARNWVGLIVLAGQVLVAHGYTRYEQGIWTLPQLVPKRPKPAQKTKPHARARKPDASPQNEAPLAEQVDTILEKIHREGLQSLTAEERRIMDRASESMRNGGR
jgi:membrane associated rhomboid family serine protease